MKSLLCLFVTVVLWAAAFPAIRAGLQQYGVGHLVLLRFAVASLALLIVACVRRPALPHRRDLPRLALLGIVGMTIYPLALSYGEITVPAGTASIFVNLSPIFTAILAAVTIGEPLSRTGWAGVLVAFSGAAMIALGRDGRMAITSGVVFVLFAAFVQAVQFVLSKSLLRTYDPLALTMYSVWSGTIVDLVFVRGAWRAITHAGASATASIVFLGVFSTVIATTSWSYALKRISAPSAAAFLYLAPPVSIVIAWIWLGETPSPATIFGGAIAILGVAIVKSDSMSFRPLRVIAALVVALLIAPHAIANPTVTIKRVPRAPRIDDFITMSPPQDLTLTRVDTFVQRDPNDGAPGTERTEAYLGYDETSLYAVFLCFDSDPSQIRAHVTRREEMLNDDFVTIQLDTFRDQRRAYEFGSNAHGVQQDAIWVEESGFDATFDTVWDSEGRVTPQGYVVWMRIPFASLRFPPGERQSWGILLTRDIPRKSEVVFSPPYTKRITGRLNQMATLEGLSGISPPERFQLIPYSAYRATNTTVFPAQSAQRGTAGIDLKTVIRDSIVVDATANPDFSQVESDEPQNAANERFELLIPEKRPFFLENTSYFATPIPLLFTRRIVDPQYGVRLSGKSGATSIGALVADDEALDRRAMNGVLRLNRELPRQSSIGLMLTNRRVGADTNRVAAIDGRVRLNENWVTTAQAARGGDGHAVSLNVNESSTNTQYNLVMSETSRDFRAALGFIPRTDVRTIDQSLQYTFYRRDSALQSWLPITFLTVDWSDGGALLDWINAYGVQFNFTRSTMVRPYYEFGADHVQPSDFPQLDRVLTKPFWHTGVVIDNNVFSQLSFHIGAQWGRDMDFFPAPGRIPESESKHRSTSSRRGIRCRGYRSTRVISSSDSRHAQAAGGRSAARSRARSGTFRSIGDSLSAPSRNTTGWRQIASGRRASRARTSTSTF
jgi:drug/metabolite transporter (DMT)-like permease